MKGRELTLVRVRLGHDLDLSTIALKVDEDKIGTSTSDSHDTTSQRDSLVLNEDLLCDLLVVVASELINSVSASEFVRVWVDVLIAEPLDKVLSILSVL